MGDADGGVHATGWDGPAQIAAVARLGYFIRVVTTTLRTIGQHEFGMTLSCLSRQIIRKPHIGLELPVTIDPFHWELSHEKNNSVSRNTGEYLARNAEMSSRSVFHTHS